jgi:hypothetical protein
MIHLSTPMLDLSLNCTLVSYSTSLPLFPDTPTF